MAKRNWKIMPFTRRDGDNIRWVKDEKNNSICQTFKSHAEANARFIAAAPETKQQRDDLLVALEEIRDLETDCCSRCEGNGRLYTDGKSHYPSENSPTILCGNCGGSGRILPEDAQEIAGQAIAKAKEV